MHWTVEAALFHLFKILCGRYVKCAIAFLCEEIILVVILFKAELKHLYNGTFPFWKTGKK